MFISTWDFPGDPADLVTRHRAMVEGVGIEGLVLHVALPTPDGLHVIDACPSREARDGWVANSLPPLLEAYGLPQPVISDGLESSLVVVEGQEA